MSRFIPSPSGSDFATWAAVVAESLADLGVIAPPPEMNWSDWACSLLNFPEMFAVPEPHGFNRWDDWAARMVETNIN